MIEISTIEGDVVEAIGVNDALCPDCRVDLTRHGIINRNKTKPDTYDRHPKKIPRLLPTN